MPEPLLSVRELSKTFRVGGRTVAAVRMASLEVGRGECLAVVGESGSGKSTLANMVLGLLPPDGGDLRFDGEPLPLRRTLEHRRRMQLVQQNPYSALNPSRSVGASLRLALDVHRIGRRPDRPAAIDRLLTEVGLDRDIARRSPQALSGGQRQRVAIARALSCNADLVVLDEPTSSLDVIVQARILRLLDGLRSARDLAYLFITHDLAVVRNIADRVAVMKAGAIVEIQETAQVFRHPRHPYTQSLIAASPVITTAEQELRARIAAATTPSKAEPTTEGPARL